MGNVKLGMLEDPESGENISNVEDVLSGLGVKLRTSNSEFRDFGDVLNEVAGKWSDYSDVQKRALAVAFSGTRQQEKFLVLMQHFPDAMKYAAISSDSAGTAVDKFNNTYLKGTEAAQDRLTASFEAMSNTMLHSDFVAGAFNTGAGILGFLNKVISTMGTIPALAGVAAGALSAIGNKGVINLKDDTDSLSGKSLNFNNPFKTQSLSIKEAKAAIGEFNDALETSNFDQKAFLKTVSNPGMKAYLSTVKNGTATVEGYTASLRGMTVASRAAALGMKVLVTALNMVIMIGISMAIEGIIKAWYGILLYNITVINCPVACANAPKKLTETIEKAFGKNL